MRLVSRSMLAIAACLTAACAPETGAQTPAAEANDESYDFLVLSLSWSPSYCLQEGEEANRQQCAPGRHPGFVVHGLWPQFEDGWPEFCDSSEPQRVPQSLVDDYLDLLPSAGLIGHQWRKHGTCTGLTQEDYLRFTRAARAVVEVPAIEPGRAIVPAAIETAFLESNDEMAKDGIAVTCADGHLGEVRICLDRQLRFRACEQVDARACTSASLHIPEGN